MAQRRIADLLSRPDTTPLKDLPTPKRIARLPTLDPDPSTYPDLIEKWTNRFHRDRPDRRPLRPLQAVALEQMEWAAAQPGPIGTIGNIPVGGGKTLTFLLAPKVFKAKRPLLLTKASLLKNHQDQIYEWASYYDFQPSRYTDDPYYGRVLSYAQLSQPNASAILREQYNPDVIFADECHLLRHPTSARTKRFLRFMAANPHVRFVGLTGTLSNSSITDFAHLMHWALREYSPVPNHEHDLSLWGSVLNVKGEPDEYGWEALHASGIETEFDQDIARENVGKKVSANVGTIMGTGMSTDVALTLEALRWPVPDEVTVALRDLSEEWVLPDGTEIVDSLAFHRALGQLSTGYYYVWDWPGEPDEEWLEARRMWWKACRDYLKTYSREGVDSPFLVEEYLRSTSDRAPLLREALANWDEQRHKEPPPTKPVWISKEPVYQALGALFAQPEPTLLWFKSRAVGEEFHKLGVATHWQESEPVPGQHAALSINIHGTGRNYQAWHRNLFFDIETNGAKMEQALGRTHRQGQKHGVWAGINQSTWAQKQQWEAMMAKARYAQKTLLAPQKVIWAAKEGF